MFTFYYFIYRNIFESKKYISNDRYYQKKEIYAFIKIGVYNEIYDEDLFINAKMNKPNKFMHLKRG